MNANADMNWDPDLYADACVIAEEAHKELCARLEFMLLAPALILDVGSGLSNHADLLQTKYPTAQIISVDQSYSMLTFHKRTQQELKLCADAYHLPFGNESVDMIFANLLLPWVDHPVKMLEEWHRVLRKEGLLIFSALGLDTLKEWGGVIDKQFMPNLHDLHDMGDWLIQQGFDDPVVDVEFINLTYSNLEKAFGELVHGGFYNQESSSVSMKKITLEPVYKLMPPFEMNFELIFAHAFKPAKMNETSSARFAVSELRKTIKKRFA